MDLSRKTDYALRILAELIRHDGKTVLSVRTAAKKNDVPYSFARSIQHDLTLAGIIQSTRGARGGMKLVKDPLQFLAVIGMARMVAPAHAALTVRLIPFGAAPRVCCVIILHRLACPMLFLALRHPRCPKAIGTVLHLKRCVHQLWKTSSQQTIKQKICIQKISNPNTHV